MSETCLQCACGRPGAISADADWVWCGKCLVVAVGAVRAEPQPISHYDSWKPRPVPGFEIDFAIGPAPDTGRDRFRVTCNLCGVVVHRATTGPEERVAQHAKECKVAQPALTPESDAGLARSEQAFVDEARDFVTVAQKLLTERDELRRELGAVSALLQTRSAALDDAHEQIDKLAKFTMEHVPGEPHTAGAVDTAIRIITKLMGRERPQSAMLELCCDCGYRAACEEDDALMTWAAVHSKECGHGRLSVHIRLPWGKAT